MNYMRQDKQYGIRLQHEVFEKLIRIAKVNRMSVAEIIRRIIDEWLRKVGQ